MNRRNLFSMLSIASIAGLVPVAGLTQSLSDLANVVRDPLIGMLKAKLGIDDNQAEGGMGSLLTLAKEKMPAGNFSKLTSLIPSAPKYMDTAKQLGAVAGPLKNMAGLNGAFSKLGMKAETAKQFVPTVTDYVGNIGGDSAKKMLLGALK